MRIGDEMDDRGEEKEPDFRRTAAARMGITVPDPEVPDPAEEGEPQSSEREDETGVPEAVRDVGLSTLAKIAEAGR